MRGLVPRAARWMAAQWWRLRVLGHDVGRAVGGLAVVFRRARRAPVPHPCVAVLAGEAQARPGERTPYRVRIHNPCADARQVTVTVRGHRDDGVAAFTVRWTVLVPPSGSSERWISTDWRDDARIERPAPAAPVLLLGRPCGRWALEASVAETTGTLVHRLVIGGGLVA